MTNEEVPEYQMTTPPAPPQPAPEAEPQAVPLRKTPDERKAAIGQQIMREVAQGGRVESQGDYMAVLVYGKRVNHLLHFFVGLFTFGFWWIVWIFMAIFGGEKRKMVQVDDFGNVMVQKA